MTISALQVAALAALAAFALLCGGYNLLRALRAREQLVTRAENLGADPQTLSDPLRRKSFLVRWADRYDRSPAAAADRERLCQAYLPWKPSDYRVIRISLGIGMLYLTLGFLELNPVLAILGSAAAYIVVPRLFFASRRNAYVEAFNAQLAELTQLLANALRAGMSIQQAIGQVVERVPEPARGEFRQTHHELMLGDNLALALTALSRRVRSRDLDVVVNAILVQHQAGGNLARVLGAMSVTLSKRRRLASEIRALTADSRFSALIVMIMPIAFLMLLRTTPLGDALFGTLIGWVLLAIFIVVQVGTHFLIQRIAAIEV
jgi:tight adherence protein B